ncbi:hypothetical protein QM012_009087 [Aureobasidium pullulans]|uniref:S-adenosyl-L-methionine-dependent methyltransferase n=1 Tax=Aureobasidium pullulans TaxID=5580 RepID=A0ABR0TJE0_AURPU
MLSKQKITDQLPNATIPAQTLTSSDSCHGSDDEPMVYKTPKDYATSARQSREHLIAQGSDPSTIILLSELPNHIQPRQENESLDDFAKRYSQTMNAMIKKGTRILNDQCTADVVASVFGTADGRVFDLGSGSGATKKEFREFGEWFKGIPKMGQKVMVEVPERWLKFERKRKPDLLV